MKIIGIVGKSGSGKTTLADALSQRLNCKNLNLDEIGHEALENENIKNRIKEVFGREVFDSDENIARKKLGILTLGNSKNLEKLTEIIWPYIFSKVDEEIAEGGEYLILEAIKLVETKFWEKCDFKIIVQADETLRKKRVIQRDNISSDYFEQRESSSIDYSKFEFDYKYNCDYTVSTLNYNINEILKKI